MSLLDFAGHSTVGHGLPMAHPSATSGEPAPAPVPQPVVTHNAQSWQHNASAFAGGGGGASSSAPFFSGGGATSIARSEPLSTSRDGAAENELFDSCKRLRAEVDVLCRSAAASVTHSPSAHAPPSAAADDWQFDARVSHRGADQGSGMHSHTSGLADSAARLRSAVSVVEHDVVANLVLSRSPSPRSPSPREGASRGRSPARSILKKPLSEQRRSEPRHVPRVSISDSRGSLPSSQAGGDLHTSMQTMRRVRDLHCVHFCFAMVVCCD